MEAVIRLLSYLPPLLRPWMLAVALLFILWGLFLRQWWKIFVRSIGRLILGALVLAGFLVLILHSRLTKRSRAQRPHERNEGDSLSHATSDFIDNVQDARARLSRLEVRQKSWPKRLLLATAAASLLTWLVGAVAPIGSSTSLGLTNIYSGWSRMETEVGVPRDRLSRFNAAPAPSIQYRSGKVMLRTSAIFDGYEATPFTVDPNGRPARPFRTVRLNKSGDASWKPTAAEKQVLKPGSVIYIDLGPASQYVRLLT